MKKKQEVYTLISFWADHPVKVNDRSKVVTVSCSKANVRNVKHYFDAQGIVIEGIRDVEGDHIHESMHSCKRIHLLNLGLFTGFRYHTVDEERITYLFDLVVQNRTNIFSQPSYLTKVWVRGNTVNEFDETASCVMPVVVRTSELHILFKHLENKGISVVRMLSGDADASLFIARHSCKETVQLLDGRRVKFAYYEEDRKEMQSIFWNNKTSE